MAMWFTPDKVFSYNAYLNFVVGARGCGKTYGTKKWAIKRFIKTGKKFIYLRRFNEEIKNMDKFFDTLMKDDELKMHNFKVTGKRFFIDGQECGRADALSKFQARKGTEEPDTDLIIFDEFIIEKSFQRYLVDEPSKLMNYMDSTFRNREGTRCICLANSISWVNPYFTAFKFNPMKSGFQVVADGEVLLNVYDNEEFTDMRKETRFGKMVAGTTYGEMAIENAFSDVNDDFIHKRGKNTVLWYNLVWKGNTYGVWYDPKKYEVVISKKHNPDAVTISYTLDDFRPNMMLLTDKHLRLNVELKRAFTNGYLYFEDVYVRNDMFDMFTVMGIR